MIRTPASWQHRKRRGATSIYPDLLAGGCARSRRARDPYLSALARTAACSDAICRYVAVTNPTCSKLHRHACCGRQFVATADRGLEGVITVLGGNLGIAWSRKRNAGLDQQAHQIVNRIKRSDVVEIYRNNSIGIRKSGEACSQVQFFVFNVPVCFPGLESVPSRANRLDCCEAHRTCKRSFEKDSLFPECRKVRAGSRTERRTLSAPGSPQTSAHVGAAKTILNSVLR
jgi:hypothetical protein